MHILEITGLVVLLFAYGQCNMKCLQCEAAKNIEDCLRSTITCGSGERCFLDHITTSNLEGVYNAGCRSETVCNITAILASSGVGRKRDLVNCAQCCDTTPTDVLPCNARLCNLSPNVTNTDKCMRCPEGVSSVNACTKTAVCQDTEICSANIRWEGSPRYYFDCEHREACIKFLEIGIIPGAGPGGRRESSLLLCSACCSGNECNKEDCFNLRKNMTIDAMGTNPPSVAAG